jgi:competence protein ComEC
MHEWEIVFWDVGQGDATSIRLPDGSFVLVDFGPSAHQGNPLPGWFRRMGNPPIELAIVTHSHVDHFGGLTALCHEDAQRIETIAVLNDAGLRTQSRSEDLEMLLQALKARKDSGRSKIKLINKAQVLYENDSLRLRIVHPDDISGDIELPADVNKTSMVLLLEHFGDSCTEPLVVFGGDAPFSALKQSCGGLQPFVLTGPHHGNPQGTKKPKVPIYWRFFKDEMHPRNIFISVGRRNGYKLPDANYVKGAASAGVKVACSQLSVKCDPDRKTDVFEGSALSGVDKPAHSVQCRGAMRVFASATGIRFDENQADFEKAIAGLFPEAPCKCHSLGCQ